MEILHAERPVNQVADALEPPPDAGSCDRPLGRTKQSLGSWPGFHQVLVAGGRVPSSLRSPTRYRLVLSLRDAGRPRQTCASEHPLSGCATVDWADDPSRPNVPASGVFANTVFALSAATGGDFARSRRWHDCAQPVGVGDELRGAAVDEHGCWASFEALRASDDPPFDTEDANLLRDAARMLARRLRQASVSTTDDSDIDPGQTGVLLIDEDLQPQGFTQPAREWFTLLKAREKPEPTPLPTHVYAVVGRLLAAESGDDPERPPRVRVRTSGARWAIVEAARMDGVGDAIAVSVHGASAEDILALVARAHGLTARERELVALVLEGLDTRELAARMFISHYTVQDHLKAVFDKLGIRSRRELVTGMFGQAA